MRAAERRGRRTVTPRGSGALRGEPGRMHGPLSELVPWSNFYVITGTAAATLIGLVFVINTLAMSARRTVSGEGISVFSTPTIIFFACALFISLAASTPWGAVTPLRVTLVVLGAAGVLYAVVVGVNTARQTAYTPGLDDWAWYVAAPACGFVLLLASAAALRGGGGWPTFGIAGAAAFFVFLGIRNAWDVVTYLTLAHLNDKQGDEDAAREKDA